MELSDAAPAMARARRRAVVLTRDNLAPHAGGKAPADVREIARRMGIACIDLPVVPTERFSVANVTRVAGGTATLLARLLRHGAPETLIIQHPIVGKLEKRLVHALFRRSRKIALIHDLDVLRKPTNHTFDDLQFLEKCDVLIAHNEPMRRFLAERLPGVAVLELGVFDFLVPTPAPAVLPPAPSPERLYVIGNLHPMKAAYLYTLRALATPVDAYGPNCETARLPDGVSWQGVIGDKGLPIAAINGFGLVWDGTSADGLVGEWGEYLRFNAPHKLSLYMTLGLPVIVHRTAAMAAFVQAEGIGFAVDSIQEATQRIAACPPEEWRACCQAVRRLRQRIVSGAHTSRAIDAALRLASEPRLAPVSEALSRG